MNDRTRRLQDGVSAALLAGPTPVSEIVRLRGVCWKSAQRRLDVLHAAGEVYIESWRRCPTRPNKRTGWWSAVYASQPSRYALPDAQHPTERLVSDDPRVSLWRAPANQQEQAA